jgi:hypothetical protein
MTTTDRAIPTSSRTRKRTMETEFDGETSGDANKRNAALTSVVFFFLNVGMHSRRSWNRYWIARISLSYRRRWFIVCSSKELKPSVSKSPSVIGMIVLICF